MGTGLFLLVFSGDAEFAPRVSGIDDASTGVLTDGQPIGRCTIVTRRLVTLAGGRSNDVSEAVQSQSRSRELLEQASDGFNIRVEVRSLLVLFPIGLKLHLIFVF